MSIEDVNISLFQWINAAATQNSFLDKIAIFASHNLIGGLLGFLLISVFFKNRKYRTQFIKTLMYVLVALLFTQVIHAFYYHPRPFAMGLGHTLVGHGSTSSFPSMHTLTVATIAFSYLLSGFRKIGSIGLLLGVIVGWSRVYVGVHFPFDIAASFVFAFIIVSATHYMYEQSKAKLIKIVSIPAVGENII
ncbi:undecaprenyl-diphosphatase [Acinetobacter sp.]|uniref:undecaprenyl-diphosphatase n=1 Tax=Acinetobacter sp. TaxID=472 RepID=UPI0031D33477